MYRAGSLLVAAATIVMMASNGSASASPHRVLTPGDRARQAATAESALRTPGVHYATVRHVCPPAAPGYKTCLGLKRVPSTSGARGAIAYTVPATTVTGPAGGYTPAALTSAYDVDPSGGSGQTVAVVDWDDYPTALSDLNAFDEFYGLPAETATSFQKVTQTGSTDTSSLTPDPDSGGEDSMDVDAIRGLCHQCKIVLIEANSGSDADLAAAEDEAVTGFGATEIEDSYGATESSEDETYESAYDHPGVVITASGGDDGWYDWDWYSGANAPETPAAYPSVVAVGGTSLTLNADGTRKSETVWDDDGPEASGNLNDGATGSGCSFLFTAGPWQRDAAGYNSAGCTSGGRLTDDVAAIGDPLTGYDVYDTYGVPANEYWTTGGGTSLSAPVVAALWALAGGAAGVSNPASLLYGHAALGDQGLYDVTSGANGFCDESPTQCTEDRGNPNGNVDGVIDCAFAATTSSTAVLADRTQCYAGKGLDGPSGVGAPAGLAAFKAVPAPTASIGKPTSPSKLALTLTAHLQEAIPGGTTGATYAWAWGDGHTTTGGSASQRHTFARAGTYTVSVDVHDGYGHDLTAHESVRLGAKPSVKASAPHKLTVKKKGAFRAKASDANTGGRIAAYRWQFGDHHTSSHASVKHAFAKKGTYHVSITVTDAAGYTTIKRFTVKVKK